MSLLFTESWDHNSSGKWSSASVYSTTTSNPRTGARSLLTNASSTTGGWVKNFLVADWHDTFIIGTGIWRLGARDGNANHATLRLLGDAGSTVHLTLTTPSDGSVRVRRGQGHGTILATSASDVLPLNAWVFLEWKAYCHDTLGRIEVRVNEVEVISLIGTEGAPVDTSGGGAGTFSGFRNMEANCQLDDLYVCNGAGTSHNDFLGDCRVQYSPVVADDRTEWSPSEGTNLYETVDEIPPNTTDYIYSDTDDKVATFEVESVPVGHDTFGVTVASYAAKNDPGTRNYRHRIETGSGTLVGTDIVPGLSYVTSYDIFPEADTGTWTSEKFNNSHFGVETR
jgi:hypothetical protein